MLKLKLFLLMALVCTSVNAADFATDAVLLQGLDKTTGRTSFLTVKVGTPFAFGDLSILVERCMKRPPEETPENSAFITITEKDNEIFRGWMFSSNPALSAMEHPVYDVWVVECKTPIASRMESLPVAEVIDSEEVDIDSLED